ncbi:MAG: sigma 54-interacting transcriptional regulator [Myxococcota bacterium]
MERTVPYGASGIPIRTLWAEVVEGPQTGMRTVVSSDRLTVGTAQGNHLQLGDPTVSRYHAELSPAPEGIEVVDCGSTNGIVAHGVRVHRAIVAPGSRLRLGASVIQVAEGDAVTVEVLPDEALAGLRGRSPLMRRLMAQIRQVAGSQVSVLVHGPSGTGKELIAQAVHELGPRAAQPFITVDCAALMPTLIASELFGHERGAFTGADQRHVGAFERAHGGTLFLDEVGELPPALQANLLGVLERRRFRRLGGREEISVDVRVVSATNRDLRSEVNAGSFRLDLYYRLAVVRLDVAPLAERREDIPLLVEHFLRECGHAGPVQELISDPAMDALMQHRWPGNVRELRNLVEATVAMGETPPLHDPGDEPLAGGATASPPDDVFGEVLGHSYKDARREVLLRFESRYLGDLLERAGGNVSKAARLAAMDRSYLIDLLRRHGLR